MATPDVPEAAVEAALADEWVSRVLSEYDAEAIARTMLAAAAPHLRADERARVLDEVQAALRDSGAFEEWHRTTRYDPREHRDWWVQPVHRLFAADYLRDTFGAGGEG